MASSPTPIDNVTYHEDVTVEMTMEDNGDISSYTLTATFTGPGGDKVTKTLGSGITVSDNGSLTTPGVVEIALLAADTVTLGVGDSRYEVWRTNAGAEARLAYGPMPIAAQDTF